MSIETTSKMIVPLAFGVFAIMFGSGLVSCADSAPAKNSDVEQTKMLDEPKAVFGQDKNGNTEAKYDAFSDPDNADLLSQYVPGEISHEDAVYRNTTVGIKYAVPDNFQIDVPRHVDNEMLIECPEEQMVVSITHAASTEKDTLNGMMTKLYDGYVTNAPSYMSYALLELSLCGEPHLVIIANHTENERQSVTAQVGFEKNGHFVTVSGTGNYTSVALGLISRVELLEA